MHGERLDAPDRDVYFQIVRCVSCDSLSFRRYFRMRNRSEAGLDEEEIFPSRRLGMRQIDFTQIPLPINLLGLYIQTESAVWDGFGTLAAIGIRGLIEGICVDQKASGRSLDKKIDSLVSLGALNKRQAESLHTLRKIGNAAAHEAACFEPDEVALAWESLEMIVKCFYYSEHINQRLTKTKEPNQPVQTRPTSRPV